MFDRHHTGIIMDCSSGPDGGCAILSTRTSSGTAVRKMKTGDGARNMVFHDQSRTAPIGLPRDVQAIGLNVKELVKDSVGTVRGPEKRYNISRAMTEFDGDVAEDGVLDFWCREVQEELESLDYNAWSLIKSYSEIDWAEALEEFDCAADSVRAFAIKLLRDRVTTLEVRKGSEPLPNTVARTSLPNVPATPLGTHAI